MLPVLSLLFLLHSQHLKWYQMCSDNLVNISCWMDLKFSSVICWATALKKLLKCKCFQKAYRLVSFSWILLYCSSSSQSLPVLPLILKCYVETLIDEPYPQALLSALLSLWLQPSLQTKLLGQSLSTLPLPPALPPQNLLQPHFHRCSSRKASLQRSVMTSSPNIMTWL